MSMNASKNEAKVEVVFILDRSGSMRGLENDTIGGFNSMLEKQQKEGGRLGVRASRSARYRNDSSFGLPEMFVAYKIGEHYGKKKDDK